MGGLGTSASFKNNVEALAAFRLNMPNTSWCKKSRYELQTFWARTFHADFGAPITGNTYNMGGALNEEEWAEACIQGCLNAGTIGCTGDGADPAMYNSGIEAIIKAQGLGIPFIKPRGQEKSSPICVVLRKQVFLQSEWI